MNLKCSELHYTTVEILLLHNKYNKYMQLIEIYIYMGYVGVRPHVNLVNIVMLEFAS